MSLIAIIDIAHPDLALAPTVRECPETSIEVLSHTSTDPETGMFFFLVDGADETFDEALERDHTVDTWSLVDDLERMRIYRLQHTEGTKLISPATIELGGLLLRAKSNDRGWTVRLHLPDREALSSVWEYCEREDISFELYRMFRRDEWTDGTSPNVTDEQRVALETAYEEGYFEEPRKTSLAELADLLEISPTAVGGRICRGTGQLVSNTLLEEDEENS
ncbi:helix-turn-helix domain-containing protein [Halostagnicola sp. A-GB9-2]|uniref:helix-turn-helix domain-containing protein n=1 Tax=Halostagnicola sp. A-GB9-2 TaxID=3048066 RepID=UPI0024C0763D|nr:helix-turn-helix domain-containing protein [Halostagnicola sp. A-GB9-2]MDJ1432740.1 helix-turn-helix domain-containing protein [Halostagnicola sp. A-GB9-2]